MTKGQYVIVRTYSAGCFAGTLVSRKGQDVTLKDARREQQPTCRCRGDRIRGAVLTVQDVPEST